MVLPRFRDCACAQVTARGEAAVRERLQELNKAVRERSSCRISIPKPARSLQSQASLGHAHSAGSPSLLGPASSLSLGATSSLTQPLDALPGSLGKSAGGSDEEIAFQASAWQIAYMDEQSSAALQPFPGGRTRVSGRPI